MAYRDRQSTFEDLRGLRAEGYIRDSTLDQKDGFGPAIQKGNEERFAAAYGLVLGRRWYTEFVSGRSVVKRLEFHRFLEDAGMDPFRPASRQVLRHALSRGPARGHGGP